MYTKKIPDRLSLYPLLCLPAHLYLIPQHLSLYPLLCLPPHLIPQHLSLYPLLCLPPLLIPQHLSLYPLLCLPPHLIPHLSLYPLLCAINWLNLYLLFCLILYHLNLYPVVSFIQAQQMPSTTFNAYLEQQGRKVPASCGDGSCLFRSQLLGTEEEHMAVCTLSIRFQNLIQNAFQQYLTAINKPTMSQHIIHTQKAGVYGTHMDILAIATYYQTPVFYCYLSGRHQQYKWHCVDPMKEKESLCRPDLSGSPLEHVQAPTHFELAYTVNTH